MLTANAGAANAIIKSAITAAIASAKTMRLNNVLAATVCCCCPIIFFSFG
jgi:hypothetical protein